MVIWDSIVGCTKKSTIEVIQKFQNKVLRSIVKAPWYIRNSDLRRDLQMDKVNEVIINHAVRHEQRLLAHENEEMNASLSVIDNIHHLKK